MDKGDELFLRELEVKLIQNRKMAERSFLPKPLQGLASYLGFHSFRVLALVSLGLTIILFWGWYPTMVEISRELFLFL